MRRRTVWVVLLTMTAAGAVDPHTPLCRQVQPGHELAAFLDGIKPAWLGLPAAVRVTPASTAAMVPASMALPSTANGLDLPAAWRGAGPAPSPDAMAAVRLPQHEDGATPQPVSIASDVLASGLLPYAAGVAGSDLSGLAAVSSDRVAQTNELTTVAPVRPPAASSDLPVGTGRMAVLVARLAAGDTDPSLATELAGIGTADLLAELRRCGWWNERDHAVADPLVMLLIDRGAVDPTHPEQLDADLTLLTAECLRRRVDARCVPLYNALLAPLASQRSAGWVHPVYGLATYYRNAGDYKQSAAVWLSAEQYTTSPAVLDDYRLEAAWTLRACGDEARATKLEDDLLKSTSGAAWTIGLVTYSRAQSLLLGGKHAELRALLSAPVPLGGAPADAPAARAVQVALDGMLADSYARTGERAQAAALWRKVLAGYEALPDRHDGVGLDNVVATARRRLAELDGPSGR